MDAKEIVALAARKRLRWRAHPEEFVRDVLRIEQIDRDFKITSQQIDALKAIGSLYRAKYKQYEVDHDRKPEDDKVFMWKPMTDADREISNIIGLSIMAGRGVGKSAFLSWVIIWFLLCFEEARLVCTSTKQDQLKTVIWAGVSQWLHAKLPNGEYAFLFRNLIKVTGERIVFDDTQTTEKGPPRFAKMAVCQKNSNIAEQQATLSGDHSPNMIMIADESAGIPDAVFEPLERTMTGKFNICIQTFNPIKNSGYAYESHYGDESKKWLRLRWNAEESEIVSKQSIASALDKYGSKESDGYRVNVLGLPPQGGDDVLIPYSIVREAAQREYEPVQTMGKVLGVDPARHGGDKTVLVLRQGGVILDIEKHSNLDVVEVSNIVLEYIDSNDVDACFVDAVGVGGGVFDNLKHSRHNSCKFYAVEVSRKAPDPDAYAKLRDFLWWQCRTWFFESNPSIPDDSELINELTDIKYSDESGKIKVEGKSMMKKRVGGSPDSADALNLTFFLPDRRFARLPRDAYDYEDVAVSQGNDLAWQAV
jgi:hypothetical protein